MSRLRSPLDELSFLHNEYLRKRILFRTSRSINRLRAALNNFVRPFGDLSSARHAVRFNLICKRCRSHGDDLSFALDMIRSFDVTRSAAAKGAVRAAKRMALRIHHGLVNGKSYVKLALGRPSLTYLPSLARQNVNPTAGALLGLTGDAPCVPD